MKIDINSKEISIGDAIRRASSDSTLLQRFLQQNTVRYANIIQSSLSEHDLFARLMGYYLKQTTLTIHGTVGLEPYNAIIVKGVIDNLSGIYNITQLTEQIEIGTFSTTIEARLITPTLLDNRNRSTTYEKTNTFDIPSPNSLPSSEQTHGPENQSAVEPTDTSNIPNV